MATSDYEAYFEPESLAALQAIFDEAWQEISALPSVVGDDEEERRTDVAQIIILAHKSGMPLERIKVAVLGRVILGASGAAA